MFTGDLVYIGTLFARGRRTGEHQHKPVDPSKGKLRIPRMAAAAAALDIPPAFCKPAIKAGNQCSASFNSFAVFHGLGFTQILGCCPIYPKLLGGGK